MKWLKRIRGMLVMGVIWAIAWGAGIGGTIELLDNLGIGLRFTRSVDMWIQTLAIPGFLAGAAFSIVLQLTERRRRFDELSIRRFAIWGAVGGGLLGGALAAAGLFSPMIPSFLARVGLIGAPLALLSSATAAGTLAIARFATKGESLGAGDETEPELLDARTPR